jgi:hypothetical protein
MTHMVMGPTCGMVLAQLGLELSRLKDDDLRTVIDLGFVEMMDDCPVVTPAGLAALE